MAERGYNSLSKLAEMLRWRKTKPSTTASTVEESIPESIYAEQPSVDKLIRDIPFEVKKSILFREREKLLSNQGIFNTALIIKNSIDVFIRICNSPKRQGSAPNWFNTLAHIVSLPTFGAIGAARLQVKQQLVDSGQPTTGKKSASDNNQNDLEEVSEDRNDLNESTEDGDDLSESERKKESNLFHSNIDNFWERNLATPELQNNPDALFSNDIPISVRIETLDEAGKNILINQSRQEIERNEIEKTRLGKRYITESTLTSFENDLDKRMQSLQPIVASTSRDPARMYYRVFNPYNLLQSENISILQTPGDKTSLILENNQIFARARAQLKIWNAEHAERCVEFAEKDLRLTNQYRATAKATYAVIQKITAPPSESSSGFVKIATGEPIRMDSKIKLNHPADPTRSILIPIYNPEISVDLSNQIMVQNAPQTSAEITAILKSLESTVNDIDYDLENLKLDILSKFQGRESNPSAYTQSWSNFKESIERNYFRNPISLDQLYTTTIHQLREWQQDDEAKIYFTSLYKYYLDEQGFEDSDSQTNRAKFKLFLEANLTNQSQIDRILNHFDQRIIEDTVHQELFRHLVLQMSNEEINKKAKLKQQAAANTKSMSELVAETIIEQATSIQADKTKCQDLIDSLAKYHQEMQSVAVEVNYSVDTAPDPHQLPSAVFQPNFVTCINVNQHPEEKTGSILNVHIDIAHAWANGAPIAEDWLNPIREASVTLVRDLMEKESYALPTRTCVINRHATHQFTEIPDLYGKNAPKINAHDGSRTRIIQGEYTIDPPRAIHVDFNLEDVNLEVTSKALSEQTFRYGLKMLNTTPASASEITEYLSAINGHAENLKRSDILKNRIKIHLVEKFSTSTAEPLYVQLKTIWEGDATQPPDPNKAVALMYNSLIREVMYVTPATLNNILITGTLKETDLVNITIVQRKDNSNKLHPALFGANGSGVDTTKDGPLIMDSNRLNFERLAVMLLNYQEEVMYGRTNGHTILTILDAAIGRGKTNFATKIAAKLFPGTSTAHASKTGVGVKGSFISQIGLSSEARARYAAIIERINQAGLPDPSNYPDGFKTVNRVPYWINFGIFKKRYTCKLMPTKLKEVLPPDIYYQVAKTAILTSFKDKHKDTADKSYATSVLQQSSTKTVTMSESKNLEIVEAPTESILNNVEKTIEFVESDKAPQLHLPIKRELTEPELRHFFNAAIYAEGNVATEEQLAEETRKSYVKLLERKSDKVNTPITYLAAHSNNVFKSDASLLRFIERMESFGEHTLILNFLGLNNNDQLTTLLHNPKIVVEVEKTIAAQLKRKISDVYAIVNNSLPNSAKPVASPA